MATLTPGPNPNRDWVLCPLGEVVMEVEGKARSAVANYQPNGCRYHSVHPLTWASSLPACPLAQS